MGLLKFFTRKKERFGVNLGVLISGTTHIILLPFDVLVLSISFSILGLVSPWVSLILEIAKYLGALVLRESPWAWGLGSKVSGFRVVQGLCRGYLGVIHRLYIELF